jgi:glycosyltransferase involved in cell wall biosynthesis
MLPVPPPGYAGTERVVATLGEELVRRGHDVTLYAPGDSEFSGTLVPTIPQSLWRSGYRGDVSAWIAIAIARAWADHERFDVIHSHVETHGFLFSRHCPRPVVSTLHGRLDGDGIPELLEAFPDVPLVSISESQRRWAPGANWLATIHHGLPLGEMPFGETPGDYLAFVGRVTPEKGIADAIALARESGLTLRAAAKVYDAHEEEHFDDVVASGIEDGTVDFLGEVGADERDPLLAGALATVMLGPWPEPFGLVAIESLATGTPVIARRAGALTETIEHGVDGFLVDDLKEAALAVDMVRDLDRRAIRERALERFSPGRMADQYEQVYETLAGRSAGSTWSPAGDERPAPEPVREPAAEVSAGA